MTAPADIVPQKKFRASREGQSAGTTRRPADLLAAILTAAALASAAGCGPQDVQPLRTADLAGEYRGKAQLAAGQPELPISLSLRSDGSFVGDFPDPHLTWGGHMRAIGSWKPAGTDAERGCLLIELSAHGRRARAHCASREPGGEIGLNCRGAADRRRRCDMKKVRPAEA